MPKKAIPVNKTIQNILEPRHHKTAGNYESHHLHLIYTGFFMFLHIAAAVNKPTIGIRKAHEINLYQVT